MPNDSPSSFMLFLAKKRRALDIQKKHAAAEAERAQVRQALRGGPLTIREISSRLGLTPDRARRRAREAGGVWDGTGHWRLEKNAPGQVEARPLL